MIPNQFSAPERLRALLRLAKRAYAPYASQIVGLTILSFFGGILEGIGINAVIPLLTFIVNTSGQATDVISNMLRSLFVVLHIDFAPKFLLTFIVVLFLARSIVMYIVYYIQIRIAADYERKTRSRLFAAMLNSSWSHLLKEKMGHLETVVMVDVPSSTGLLKFISGIIMLFSGLIVYLVVAFNISTIITLCTIGFGILFFLFLKPLLSWIRGLGSNRVQANRATAHHVAEHISGIKSVKAAGVEAEVVKKGFDLFDDMSRLTVRISMLQQVPVLIIPPLGVLYIALIFGIAFRTHFVTLAALPAIVYLIYRMFTYMQQLQSAIQGATEMFPHLQSVLKYSDAAAKESEGNEGTLPFAFERELKFENVRFSYEDSSEVLQDVSFRIERGSMIGLIGPSGAGKTTCVDLILRLLTPQGGSMMLDGVDAREVSLNSWRRNIAYVSQDLFLLHDSIRNNIAFYDESVSDEEIWDAAKLAQVDDVIKESPEGLDTVIGERGLKLSAGQRQRIVIARALLRKPQLLILDEATSALDTESEEKIKNAVHSLKGRMTIIAIAHRLSTIMDADKLIVLEKGKVTEEGLPKELLKDKDSYFFKVNAIVE